MTLTLPKHRLRFRVGVRVTEGWGAVTKVLELLKEVAVLVSKEGYELEPEAVLGLGSEERLVSEEG